MGIKDNFSRFIRDKRFRPNKFFSLVGIAAVLTGATLAYSSLSASALVLDTTLPQPRNIQAHGDDQSIIVTWEGSNNNRVVGYYITYRPVGSDEEYIVRQQVASKTQFNERTGIIQLQPLENGVEYEINVQSASGSTETFQAGSLVSGSGDSQVNRFARADGRVSAKATTTAAPTSERVDALRAKYTIESNGFFDDFNYAAGPFDELKWNNAANGCVQPGTAAAFVNPQYHAHNMSRSFGQCDRAGLASRARAVFDITGATEIRPAELSIDIDGVTHNRDTWYLDLVPLDSRSNNLPIDITSHNDIDDRDNRGPGNMIRINARQSQYSLVYYDANFQPRKLNLFTEGISCGQSSQGNTVVQYTNCDFSSKKDGISPIAETDYGDVNVANVRKNWIVRIVDNKIRIYVNSTFVGSADLPTEFTDKKKYTVQSTLFSYNTGKETREGVVPYVEFLHWDNLGFNAPLNAPKQDIVFNYLEGQEDAKQPIYSTGTLETQVDRGNRSTKIPIPDDIGTLKDGKANFYFTVFNKGDRYYSSPDDHIIFNGTRYDVPTMRQSANNNPAQDNFVDSTTLFNHIIQINQEDIKKGINDVSFVLNGDPNGQRNKQADTINVHLELPYTAETVDAESLTYTQPKDVFGGVFLDIVQPRITNCDYYRVIEKDLGLPYQTGKNNFIPGPCVYIDLHASAADSGQENGEGGQHGGDDNSGVDEDDDSVGSDNGGGDTTPIDPGNTQDVCQDEEAINTGGELPCDYPAPLPDPEVSSLAEWEFVDIGTSQPQVNIADAVYPNSLGVQFFYNGEPDDRNATARPNGFDATGPQENSRYHMFPDITLNEGDTLEARWTDRDGVLRRSVITIQQALALVPACEDPGVNQADWLNAFTGTRQPEIVIPEDDYPNSLGVQFFYNGEPDDRNATARPNGFDATGPQENSRYHMYPDIVLAEGDIIEARWTDRDGVLRRNVITISQEPVIESTCENPVEASAEWEDAVSGTSQPQVNIADAVYPNSLGVQFFYNGEPDDRNATARPNGFDATGPQENSRYHMFPDITLNEGDTLEARWTDRDGVLRRSVITVTQSVLGATTDQLVEGAPAPSISSSESSGPVDVILKAFRNVIGFFTGDAE